MVEPVRTCTPGMTKPLHHRDQPDAFRKAAPKLSQMDKPFNDLIILYLCFF